MDRDDIIWGIATLIAVALCVALAPLLPVMTLAGRFEKKGFGMKINWKIRLQNPVWWAQMACAVVLPLVVGMGYEWTDMTSWATLGDVIAAALGNPVICASMLASAWACITDPTTSGTSDSASALGREKLKPNVKKEG